MSGLLANPSLNPRRHRPATFLMPGPSSLSQENSAGLRVEMSSSSVLIPWPLYNLPLWTEPLFLYQQNEVIEPLSAFLLEPSFHGSNQPASPFCAWPQIQTQTCPLDLPRQ